MVCIEKRPHILYGRSSAPHFRYLTCLLDRGHITCPGGLLSFSPFILPVESGSQNFKLEKYIFPSLEKKNGQNWEIRIYTQKKQ